MFKNCWYNTKKSEIHLWEQLNGEDLHTVIPWTPYVYVPADRSDIKTIYGNIVRRKDFPSFYKYSKFLENNKRPNIYENNVRQEIQFLAERYYGIPDDELYVPKLKIYHVDIEVLSREGFPDPKDADAPVVLASIRNSITKNTIVFGYDPFEDRDYNGNLDNIRYIKCNTEEELLLRFFNYMHKFPCDILSGYFIWSFDIPYLINRAKKIWGEEKGTELYNRMSPVNVVKVWKQKNSDEMNIDIPGLTILDYYNVYRWYGKKLERYTLEYVSQTELGIGKLDWRKKYETMWEFAEKNWNKFTDYNVIDCERVDDLEEKLGYIRMIQGLSLLCKSPMKYYNAQTQLIEGLMLTYYRRNNLCAPHFYGGNQESFPAAHVKEPQKGMHEWVVDVDITSSYPSHIIALNMSLETFVGKIERMKEEEIIAYTRNREFPDFYLQKEVRGEWEIKKVEGGVLRKFNNALKRGLLAIAPNGAVFSTNKTGVISTVEKFVFFKRKEVKGKRKEAIMKSKECDGTECKRLEERSREYDSLQLALKIMMNAFFGIIAVPYSRYFNVHISSAITACGRHTIKSGEKFTNTLLNDPNQELKDLLSQFSDDIYIDINENKDYVAYIDTDSLFVKLGEWIEDKGYGESWKKLPEKEKIEMIKKISAEMEKYIDNRIFNETQLGDYNSQVHDFKIGFKQEIIAQTALFVKKKKYAYWLKDKEGVPSDKIDVTGLEIVRSDSAEAIRPRLKQIMEMIMKQATDDEISIQMKKYKKELMLLEPEDLAANLGINNIRKYIRKDGPIKGTPWHVKGVWNNRLLLNELGIQDLYEDIHEGNKAKVVYVKKNPYNVETITFNDWPKEYNSIVQFDKQKMIEKFFVKKVKILLEPLGKEHITENDPTKLNAFFSV